MPNVTDPTPTQGFAVRALACLPYSVLSISSEGVVLDYHRGACDAGIAAVTSLGAPLASVLPAAAAQALQTGVSAALAGSETKSVFYALHSETDPGATSSPQSPRYIKADIVPEDARSVFCFLRDITEQRLSEQVVIRRDVIYAALTQIYHRLFTAEPEHPSVTPDTLAMLGYAAGADVAYFVDLAQTDVSRPSSAVGVFWSATREQRAGRSGPGRRSALRRCLAIRPLAEWLPILRRGRSVQAAADAADPAVFPTKPGLGACLIVPVLVQDELVGLLGFEQPRRVTPWPAQEAELLRAAATAISFHLERRRYARQLEAGAQEIAEMTGDLATARDLARASDRAKSEFLSIVGHELRTPLNPVISMIEMLLDASLTAEQQEYAEIAHQASLALLKEINEILAYTEIETGGLELLHLPFEPADGVEAVVDQMMARAQEKQLTLMSFCHPETPSQLVGDPQRVQQILNILVDNALKFTEQGEVLVRVEPARSPSKGDGDLQGLSQDDAEKVRLRFSVTDTGIGLAPNADRWLFRPFTQADTTCTRRYGGIGLGLATAKRWVMAMGGDISARANPAGGSIFSFTVPFETVVDDEPSMAEGLTEHKQTLAGLRVLVVDDQESNRQILATYLEGWQVACTPCGDSREALSLLTQAHKAHRPYHIAILDLVMPEIDGLALAAAIQQRELSPTTRLVLISAYGRSGLDVRARRSGFSAYLAKPFRRAQLYESLVEVMSTVDPPTGVPVSTERAAPSARPAQTQTEPGARPQVLLVEDNTILQRMAAEELEQAGFDVHAVSSKRRALAEVARLVRPALVLIDVQQPEPQLSGLISAVREQVAGFDHRVAIVGMTAQACHTAAALASRGDLQGYLLKPLTSDAARVLFARWGPAPGTDDVNGEKIG